MAVEQSLHYCLSESKMIVWNIYGQPLGINVGTVQLPSLHIAIFIWDKFFGMLVISKLSLLKLAYTLGGTVG